MPTTAGTIAAAAGAGVSWIVRADLDVILGSGSAVSAWGDQSANAAHFTQATAGFQPTFVASAVNGQPAIQFDGVDDVLTNTCARAAPGTTPYFLWIIAQQNTWTLNDTLYGDGGMVVLQSASLGGMKLSGSAVGPQNNNWTGYKLFRVQCLNTTGDYLKIGSVSATGTNTGNLAGTGNCNLGGAGGGIRFIDGLIAEAMLCTGTLTSLGTLDADLQSYATTRYGASVMA